MKLNIVIYPSINSNQTELMFSRRYKKLNFIFIDSSRVKDLSKIMSRSIKSVTILLDNYGIYIKKNIETIIKNKHVRFFIYENNIHYLSSKTKSYKRLLLLREKLKNNDHIYILSSYWYFYKNLYQIDKNNLISFPHFVFKEDIQNFNYNVFLKVLLYGPISKYYPMRKYIKKLNNKNVNFLSTDEEYNRTEILQTINKYVCAFTCCMNINMPYIGKEFFEICGSGALLLAYDEFVKKPLQEIGFIDGENYISCTKDNLIEKINYITNQKNLREINRIRKNGHELVKKKHTNINRYWKLYQLTSQIF